MSFFTYSTNYLHTHSCRCLVLLCGVMSNVSLSFYSIDIFKHIHTHSERELESWNKHDDQKQWMLRVYSYTTTSYVCQCVCVDVLCLGGNPGSVCVCACVSPPITRTFHSFLLHIVCNVQNIKCIALKKIITTTKRVREWTRSTPLLVRCCCWLRFFGSCPYTLVFRLWWWWQVGFCCSAAAQIFSALALGLVFYGNNWKLLLLVLLLQVCVCVCLMLGSTNLVVEWKLEQ